MTGVDALARVTRHNNSWMTLLQLNINLADVQDVQTGQS